MGKWNFRKALAVAGLNGLLPKLEPSKYPSDYGVPASELPEPLASEVKQLLVWKQAKYMRGRPQWTRHRPVTAKLLEKVICRLFGFAQNIGKFCEVTTLKSLFTEEIVSAYIEWGLNERGLTRSTLLRLSMIYGALRHHPNYKGQGQDQGYQWFSALFDGVPEDDQSVAQAKKAKKSVPYEELCKIPGAIRAARLKLNQDDVKASRLAHEELMVLWLTTLVWRQRNLRECRVGEPESANLFFAPLPAFIHVAKPKWVEEALETNSKEAFWQFYFRATETKTGQEVRGILPRRLIPVLEEYLAIHRPRLVAADDPGTLFVNADGNAISYQIMTYHISEIVLKHAGRRMTPHLFRDAFAYAYLDAHPEDFLTLSKILWHQSIKYTLSVYGRNFDESNGVRRIDEWLGAAA
jgi:integrase